MLLNEELKNCLMLAAEDDTLDIDETLHQGFVLYVDQYGVIEVDDDDEGLELVKQAYSFLADLTLNSLIMKGMMEFSAVDENGEMLYGMTELGREVAKEIIEREGL